MVTKDGSVEKTLQNFGITFKFYGEGWSEERIPKNDVVAKTISEPTDSYMITSV